MENDDNLSYIFLVQKLGRRKITHKCRILRITKNRIEYYPMIPENKSTASFHRALKEVTSQIENGNYDDEILFGELSNEFLKLEPRYRNEKSFFDEYTIEEIKEIDSFNLAPIKVTNKAENIDRDNPINYWYMETGKEQFRKAIRNADNKIRSEKNKINLNDSNDNINNTFKTEEDNKEEKSMEEEKYRKKEFKEKDKIRFIEFEYQRALRMYMEIKIKDKNKEKEENMKTKLILELLLYFCYGRFVKHCEKIVKKIIYDLSTFEKADASSFQMKLHPIVFPNPYYFSQEHNAVLLYSIWGVNYTVTWNRLKAHFNTSFTETIGKWKGLKEYFKQRDYFQNLIMKISSLADNAENFPTVPMSCVIDYNGFRVFCESDIQESEESVEGYKISKLSQGNQIESPLVKDIAKLLNETLDKTKNENVTSVYEIVPKAIFEAKNFDLDKYYEAIMKDFKGTFEKKAKDDNNYYASMNERKNEKATVIQTEKQFLKCLNKLYGEHNDFKSHDSSFENFYFPNKAECDFFKYLMQFNILVPSHNQNVFYRQEITFNNINLDFDNETELNEIRSISKQKKNSNANIMKNKFSKDEQHEFAAQLKEKEQLILSLLKNNTIQGNPSLKAEMENAFNEKLNHLIMLLDSMYILPYNSETLKIAFHHYGINLHYLGKVAERTRVPHVRELCVIEMFARVCKRIIFDLLAQSTFDKAMGAFYVHTKELTTTLNNVPVSFNLIYGNEYLKSITQPVERIKFPIYNGVEITGLYLTNRDYPLPDPKDNGDKVELYDNTNFQIKYQLLSNFLTVLFAEPNTKANLELYGQTFNSTQELWDYIIHIIIEKYDIVEVNDVFLYCKLDRMPICALVSAMQYHTGIKFQNGLSGILEKTSIQKFDSTVFESITPLVKSSYYSFNDFICKKNIILPLKNEFGMCYPSDLIYYQAKLNYYAEKYLFQRKISQNFYYLYYIKILKGWDIEKKIKKSFRDNTPKEFDQSVIITDNVTLQIHPVFEENFDAFIGLMYSQYQSKSVIKNYRNDPVRDSQNKTDTNYLFACERIITSYWGPKHIFLAVLRLCYAKAMYKNTNSRKEEAKIFNLLKSAVSLSRDALGELNIFYGKTALDAGMFFDKNLSFLEASKMYSIACKVFKYNKKYTKEKYYYSLKYLTKSLVYLGDFEGSLEYGRTLIKELYAEKEKNNFWDEMHNMAGFTFNMMKIAKMQMKYNTCVEIGNIFFKLIRKPESFVIKPFKNWIKTSEFRVREFTNMKNEQNNKGEHRYNTEIRLKEYEQQFNLKEKKIDNIIKLYLKCLFLGLNTKDAITYSKIYVHMIDNCKPKLNTINMNVVNEDFMKLFFRKDETFEDYFKTQILYYLRQKFEIKKYGDEMQESINTAVKEMEIIYYKFSNSKMFKY